MTPRLPRRLQPLFPEYFANQVYCFPSVGSQSAFMERHGSGVPRLRVLVGDELRIAEASRWRYRFFAKHVFVCSVGAEMPPPVGATLCAVRLKKVSAMQEAKLNSGAHCCRTDEQKDRAKRS